MDEAELRWHALDGINHQPRERTVPCRRCRRPTWRFHAVCDECGPATCDRCDTGTR